MRFPAPAKLNLFLHIVGRRPDGYHLLQSVFRFLDYGDFLEFALRDDGRIARTNVIAAVPETQDLCVRAAHLLQQESGCRLGVDITLDKRLPMGGGLGGGSSDAATTLLALNHLWRTGLDRPALQRLGLKLGADVPVFIFGESAFAQGVGEILQPLALPPAWYVVLIPPVSVATVEVFADLELTRDTIPSKIGSLFAGYGHNDLEPVVCRRFPSVARCLGWLKQFGDARMTGSGACVFAGFGTESQARAVFAQRPATMKGFVACGMDNHPLRDLA